MAKDERSLLEKLRALLFGSQKAHKADQKDKREAMGAFLKEHDEEKEARDAGLAGDNSGK